MNIVLLSGGSGKRLWPLSNDIRSKQFIKIFKTPDGDYESMVQRVYHQIRRADENATVTKAPDAGADLQYAAGGVRAAGGGDLAGDPVLDKKVLPHGLGEAEAVAAQQGADLPDVAEIHRRFLLMAVAFSPV